MPDDLHPSSEAKANSSPTSIEEKKWYKNTKAIVTLVGGIIGIGTGVLVLSQKNCDTSHPKAQQNVEIIMDSSLAMSTRFEDGTKRDAAIRALGDYLHGHI